MAEKGYLLSEALLKKIRKDHQKLMTLYSRSLGKQYEYGGKSRNRFFVKITGRYKGSGFDVDNNIAYTGVEVSFDSGNDAIANRTLGNIWGDDTDSTSFSPIIDLTMANYDYDQGRLSEQVHINIGTVVEVFSVGNKDRQNIWCTYGAKDNEYVNDSAYPVDSTMLEASWDSTIFESALTNDSGWPTASNNSGFTVTVQTRTYYGSDSTQDQILYGYYRDFTYNAMGVLVALSEERREIIDTPDSCGA